MQDFQIISLVSLIVIILAMGVYAAFLIKAKSTKGKEEKTSADFINVQDIRDNEIYTLDGKAISIYKITPINTSLMTAGEKNEYISIQAGYLSTIKTPYKLLAVPRPVDVQPCIEARENQKANAGDVQKRLINEEIFALSEIGRSGTIIEKNFYLVYWDTPEEIKKSRQDFIKAWNDSGVNTSLLSQAELIGLCNLVFNPSYTNQEVDVKRTIPILEEE